ncbi:hypothetical protein CcaverHIS002_0608860 [Cutaneotrichosporon cavernicola]|uniref:Tetraspanin Tsp2 n=1 Tax=Cutaneotrichosporon cavernicola TaxID=279322 RepID=A0AA48L9C6_9TREE|nr:uncharacterized protein CcaverHIS019_0608320 [Cutaneotrichosporon cavernicola]BEI86599.1 hypothetical protein CcaverHIS002_0608860 [Cutaneotrichosporon cavernicola]BEI94373.1 hypothetical protein CcaverHIS019_0608320 [Cutaneotrichosporon cavernicola]BEJ02150.1 hypothetical protein CcaverHIS631_0608320 [Cutaneotrichosporon cavernicola]BEJ09911.1 hypothetical protein CcaverHIS641_0608260 [Cutaneotrichosporon cavernicola]
MSARNKLADLASRARPRHQNRARDSGADQDAHFGQRSPSPGSSNDHFSGSYDHSRPMQEVQYQDALLVPPNLPFSEVTGGQYSDGGSSRDMSYTDLAALRARNKDSRPASLSLSINYVPTKFSKLHAPGDYAHRRAKQGGGRDAFAAGAARMGEPGLVDDDEGLVFQVGKGGLKAKHKPKLRWNRFKWILFCANCVLFVYGMAGLICSILVWINVFFRSDILRVGNRDELILSTIAGALIVFTSLLGFSGIFLNNRPFLAVYVVLLWVCLGFMVAPGYITYKRKTFNLEGKINQQWSRRLGTIGRLRVQDALKCCGYFSPSVEATISPLCYPRSVEDGCKNRYLKLERVILRTWYTVSFSLVPPHILIILAGLLCSNHVTYRFGKGLTPKRYRLDMDSMAVIMNDYATQIAAQYGPEVANEAVTRSSLHLDSRPGSRAGSRAGSRRNSLSSSAHGHGTPNYRSPSRTQNYTSPFDDSRAGVSGRSDQTHYTDMDEDSQGHGYASNQGHSYDSPQNQGYTRAQPGWAQ